MAAHPWSPCIALLLALALPALAQTGLPAADKPKPAKVEKAMPAGDYIKDKPGKKSAVKPGIDGAELNSVGDGSFCRLDCDLCPDSDFCRRANSGLQR